MLAIKFKRIGKKKQASYRIVVIEKRSKVSGRFVDDLGWYNPRTKEFKIDREKAERRLKTGAQPTDTVFNLLVRAEIVKGPKRPVHAAAKSEKSLEAAPAEVSPEIPAEAEAEKPATA